jgi:hypothetical protein
MTVTGIGLHYKWTAVYFRELVAEVRRVLQQTGVRIDANGSISIDSEEGVEVQALRAAPTSRRIQTGRGDV